MFFSSELGHAFVFLTLKCIREFCRVLFVDMVLFYSFSCHALVVLSEEITKWLRLWGTSAGQLVQLPSSGRATQSQLPSSVSKLLLSISKEGDTAASLGNLYLCSFPLTVKMYFLVFRQNLLYCSFYTLPLALSLDTGHRALPQSLPYNYVLVHNLLVRAYTRYFSERN